MKKTKEEKKIVISAKQLEDNSLNELWKHCPLCGTKSKTNKCELCGFKWKKPYFSGTESLEWGKG